MLFTNPQMCSPQQEYTGDFDESHTIRQSNQTKILQTRRNLFSRDLLMMWIWAKTFVCLEMFAYITERHILQILNLKIVSN